MVTIQRTTFIKLTVLYVSYTFLVFDQNTKLVNWFIYLCLTARQHKAGEMKTVLSLSPKHNMPKLTISDLLIYYLVIPQSCHGEPRNWLNGLRPSTNFAAENCGSYKEGLLNAQFLWNTKKQSYFAKHLVSSRFIDSLQIVSD